MWSKPVVNEGGKIVVMNMGDYENACLQILTKNEYYKKLPYNSNEQYKQSIAKETEKLTKMNYITNFKHSTLNEGDHTCLFYSLLRLHKSFTLFSILSI